MQLLTSLVML